jgi:hypothetical protein
MGMSRGKLALISVLIVVAAASAVLIFRLSATPHKPVVTPPAPALATKDPTARSRTAAVAFRAILIEAPELAQSVIAQMPAGIAPGTTGSTALGPLAWQTFFAAAVIHIGAAASDHPQFVYYNPLTDVAVIGIWDFSQTGPPKVTSLCAIPGSSTAAATQTISRYPQWRKAIDPFADLSKTLQMRMHSISERFPESGTGATNLPSNLCSASQQSLAELRILDTMTDLTEFARSQAKEPFTQLLKTTGGSTPAALGVSFPDLPKNDLSLLVQAAPAFGKFKPAAAMRSENRRGYLVVLVDARSAQRFLIVDIADDHNAWRVRHFIGLSLAT